MCRQVAPSRLAAANSRLRGMRVGEFELVDEQLHLGDANGNRFEVPCPCDPSCTISILVHFVPDFTPLQMPSFLCNLWHAYIEVS